MLVGFTFENFRSFYNETSFSMVADLRDKSFMEKNTFPIDHGEELLKSCLVYGSNGSGKTNFLSAISYMREIIIYSMAPNSDVLNDENQFLYKRTAHSEPMKFSIMLCINNILYEYGFSVLEGKIIEEYLYKTIKRRTNIFLRTDSSFESIKINSPDFNNIKKFVENTRDDVLFLAVASFGNNIIAKEICDWFQKIQVFDANDTSNLLSTTLNYLSSNDKGKSNLLKFINEAGIDMQDFRLDIKATDVQNPAIIENGNLREIKGPQIKKVNAVDLKIPKKVYDESWKECDTIEISMNQESSGTRKLFEVSGPVLKSIENGSLILIDEIDSKLHPALVRHIVMLFNSIDKNPKNAQLICNTHDIMFLDDSIRRDQIYFVEKDNYGKSVLYSLNDFVGIRKNSKILKQYLVGAYGALPDIKE